MAHRHRATPKSKYRTSGRNRRLVYASTGSAVASEAETDRDSFNRGGRVRDHNGRFVKHDIGRVSGSRAKSRADKRPRNQADRSPFSSAARSGPDAGDIAQTPACRNLEQPGGGRGSERPHPHRDAHHFGGHPITDGQEEELELHPPSHHEHGGAEDYDDGGASEDAGVRRVEHIHRHYHYSGDEEE